MNYKDKLQEAFEAGYLQGLSESTTIDTSSYRRSHGKSPNPNESGGWSFGTKPFSRSDDEIVYESSNKMPYKEAKKEAEKIAKKKGLKKIYVQA